jgi:hypothetical protein
MGTLIQYLCNLNPILNIPCHWCLPIGLDSSPQSLCFYLSSPEKSFLFGPGIFTTKLPNLIHLGWLCKEDLLLCPFFVFLCSVIPCKLRFLKARIRKCLFVLSKQEVARSSKERKSLFTLQAFLHL